MNKLVLSIAIATVVLAGNVTAGSARADSTPSVEHASFSGNDLEGWMEYSPVYIRVAGGADSHELTRPNQSFQIYLKVKNPAPLFCMDYRDFRFELRDSSGLLVAQPTSDSLKGSVIPEVSYGLMAVPNHCPYEDVRRHDAQIYFRLDKLYPHLELGTYNLAISVVPRPGFALQSVKLPVMAFRIVDK
jgi:hypothetical protein